MKSTRVWVESSPLRFVFGFHDRAYRRVHRLAAIVSYDDDVKGWMIESGPRGSIVMHASDQNEAMAIGQSLACAP